jgi:hypothetical protein
MDCREDAEWNFAYVLPQLEGEPAWLVIPTLLQMRWVELPPYFCAAIEMAWDIATTYIESGIGTRPKQTLYNWVGGIGQPPSGGWRQQGFLVWAQGIC